MALGGGLLNFPPNFCGFVDLFVGTSETSVETDLVTRPEVLTGAGPDLQPAALIVAELGGPQLVPRQQAAHHQQLA